jgi:hypothetical protein
MNPQTQQYLLIGGAAIVGLYIVYSTVSSTETAVAGGVVGVVVGAGALWWLLDAGILVL